MSAPYRIRATRLTVAPDGASIYDERCTHVQIEDEGAGEFVKIWQEKSTEDRAIAVDPAEWPLIQQAVERLLGKEATP